MKRLPRVLLLRPGAMGDVCMTIPVARALQACCELHWLIFEHYAPLVRHFDLNAHLIQLLSRKPRLNESFVRFLEQLRFDAILDLCHWPETSQLAGKLIQIPIRAATIDPEQDRRLGINPHNLELQAPFNRLVRVSDNQHQVEKWRRLIGTSLGISIKLTAPPLKVQDSSLLRIFLQPHAGKTTKIWPLSRWADVLSALSSTRRIEVSINGGNRQELPRSLALWARLRWRGVRARIIFKDRSFGRMIAALRAAHLALGNDSGPMHLASIMGVPSLVVYGPYSPTEFSPIWYSAAAAPHTGGAVKAVSVSRALKILQEFLHNGYGESRKHQKRPSGQVELAR